MHKNIRVLTWFNFFTDFKLYAAVAIIYFTQITGSFAAGMSIFSIALVSAALFEIPTGIFSDKIGRKRTVVLGAIASIGFAIFYAIGTSFVFLAIGALFEGLSRSLYSGNNDALLHDTLAENNQEHLYDEHLGKTSSMFQVALAISAVVGSVIAHWSFPLIMWLSVIPQIICFYLSTHLAEPKRTSLHKGNIYYHLSDAIKSFFKNKKLRLLSLVSIIGYGSGEASYQFQSAFYQTIWPVWAIGFAKVLSNIGASASFYFSGKILKKIKPLHLLITSDIYNRIINSIAVIFPSVLSPLLMSSSSVFFGVSTVAKNTLMQKEFKPDQRATMGSLNSFASNLFFGAVAIGMGYIADLVSPAMALLVIQILIVSKLFIYRKLFSYNK